MLQHDDRKSNNVDALWTVHFSAGRSGFADPDLAFAKCSRDQSLTSAVVKKQATPLRPHWHEIIGLQPRQPARRFRLRVCPVRDTIGGGQFRDHSAPLQFFPDLVAEPRVPLSPGFEMLTCRQPVSLLAIAAAVRQDEVMAEIHRVTRPGDKVIDVDISRR
jgi:hypothetical protein